MIGSNPYVARALTHIFARNMRKSDDRAIERHATLTRIDMNLYMIHFPSSSRDWILEERRRDPIATTSFDHTSTLMRLISIVMQDVQQRNLNAKHSAATTSATATSVTNDHPAINGTNCPIEKSLYDHGEIPENVYIGLNRSCAQRKYLEICCKFYNIQDALLFSANSMAMRVIARTPHYVILYAIVTKRSLNTTMQKVKNVPRLIFASCKNILYAHSKELYICNFLLYHSYHECNRTFDETQFGVRYKHSRLYLFLLALVNAELLRVGRRTSANLSLNMQSLGKAYNDVGFHIFAENSIQHMCKIQNDSIDIFTDGLLVNRHLGRVSKIGINSVRYSTNLY